MKRKIALLMTVIALLAIAIPGSLAYFTAEDRIHNVITSDGVDIQLREYQKVGDKEEEYPQGPIAIMPGTKVSKIPKVENLEAESYIRAKIDIIVKDANGTVMDLDQATLDSIITISVKSDWTSRRDDDTNTTWWYYNRAVGTGEFTTALFEEVVFSGPNMTNEYQNCTVEIIVTAQAVQAANNGDSALEAKGWSAGTQSEG